MKYFLSAFLLISIASYSQDTTVVLSYNERISYDFDTDSTVKIDTLKLNGSFLQIKIYSDKIEIPYFDTLLISSRFRRLDSAQIFVLYRKKIISIDSVWIEVDTTAPLIMKLDTLYEIEAPITAILRENYMDFEYPKPHPYSGSRTRTVMFVIPPKPPYSD